MHAAADAAVHDQAERRTVIRVRPLQIAPAGELHTAARCLEAVDEFLRREWNVRNHPAQIGDVEFARPACGPVQVDKRHLHDSIGRRHTSRPL